MKDLGIWLMANLIIKDEPLYFNMEEVLKRNRRVAMDSLQFNRVERERLEAPEDQVAECECCGEVINGEPTFVKGFSYHHECLFRKTA